MSNEAWAKAGIASPSSAQTTRMQDEWLEEIFNEILDTAVQTGRTNLKTLQDTLYDASVKGSRTIDLAEAFDEEVAVAILDGTERGTAQAGSTTTITLASDEDITEARILGKDIFITGGTSADSISQCTAYDTTTKVATVSPTWTAPASGSTYLVVEKVHLLEEINIEDLEEIQPMAIGIPSEFAKYKRQLIFDRAFDISTYGIRLRYFVNIHEVDRAGTLYTRILQNWRGILVQGLYYKALESQGDTEWEKARSVFGGLTAKKINKEIPYGGEFQGFTL